jgi:hypothetical protein
MTAILAFLLTSWNWVRSFASWAAGFLSKPPGIYIAAVVLVGVAVWWSGQRGYDAGVAQGKAACEAAHSAATAREVTRQQVAGAGAVQASEARTIQSAAQDRTNREIVADVQARAESLPPPPVACPAAVPADLADRLRQLR